MNMIIHWLRDKYKSRLFSWNKYAHNPQLPSALRVMLADYQAYAGTHASKFWIRLGNKHIRQFLSEGYDNFKQTIALKYFTFPSNRNHNQLDFLLSNLNKEAIARAEKNAAVSRLPVYFDKEWALKFNTTTFLLYEYALQQGLGPLLKKLHEPTEGNSPSVTIDGREISQDLINSALEYDSITRPLNKKVGSIMEIGAGYGRNAFVFLNLRPQSKYIIVDIPPALYISQRYLSSQFPHLTIFEYRNFKSFIEIEKEFNNSQLIFLMPWQLGMIPDKSIDVFVAIDSLHEMKYNTIQYYFSAADRITRSYFYFKCWKSTDNRLDNVTLREDNYPIPPNWRRIYSRECRVQVKYFEALYEL